MGQVDTPVQIQQKLRGDDPTRIQDGLHNLIQTPEFRSALAQAIAVFTGGLFEPSLLESFRRYIASADRNDSRSFLVGVQPVKILERDPSRAFAFIYNNALPTAAVQTDVDASSANAAAANNVTLPGVAGATTYITGFEITGDGATAGSIIAVTVTGILGGTKTYYITIPAGVGTSITPLIVEFARPIPASAVNTAIVVNVPSFGAGNTNAAVTAHGFQLTPATAAATVYVGGRQVTTGAQANDPSGGIPVPPGLLVPLMIDNDIGELWAVASAAGIDVRVLDCAGGI